jgi:hypothetical protein
MLVTPEEAEALIPLFNQGLFTIFRSWRRPMYDATRVLINLIGAPLSDADARLCAAAFLLLPGLVMEPQRLKRISVVDLLRILQKESDATSPTRLALPSRIFGFALEYQSVVNGRNNQSERQARSLTASRRLPAKAYVRKVENLVREKRISSAMNIP